MDGCARRLPELDFPFSYCCRTCRHTGGRRHGPEYEARESAAIDDALSLYPHLYARVRREEERGMPPREERSDERRAGAVAGPSGPRAHLGPHGQPAAFCPARGGPSVATEPPEWAEGSTWGHRRPKDGGVTGLAVAAVGSAPNIRSAAVGGKLGDRSFLGPEEPSPGVWCIGAEEIGRPAALRRAAADVVRDDTRAAWSIGTATHQLAEATIEEALARLEYVRGRQCEAEARICSMGREEAAWARLRAPRRAARV